jgi:plastocyanin
VRVGGPPPNTAPSATATLSGTAQAGQTLTGSDTYSDAENDAENAAAGGSRYRFVRSVDHDVATAGDNTDDASGDTLGGSPTYTVQAADVGDYLFYCVTPAAQTGASPGSESCSAATALVSAAPTNGACGASDGGTFTQEPTGTRCSVGTPSAVASTTTAYTWSCAGANGGSTASCAATRNYVVTPGTDPGTGSQGSISPATDQSVAYRATPSFTATANPGFKLDSFTGTCLGARSGNSFTLDPVTADCTIKAVFAANDPPTAAVTVSGTGEAGAPVTGSAVYSDTENDPEDQSAGGTSYRFVLSGDDDVTTTGDNRDAASGATRGAAQPYVPLDADVGQYIFYCVTPKATAGALTGAEVCTRVNHQVFVTPIDGACGPSNKLVFTTAPISKLCRSGVPSAVAPTPTAYPWSCAGLKGGASASCAAIREYDITPAAGANGSLGPATSQRVVYQATPSFTATPAAGFKVLSFSGCPGAQSGDTFTLAPVTANCTVQVTFTTNDPPTADVAVAGSGAAGQPLTGSYSYRDTENDAEDLAGATYRFVLSDDHEMATTGDNRDAASGSPNGAPQTFTPAVADIGKYLFYCVTPRATAGTLAGTEACSPVSHQIYQGPIAGQCGASAGLTFAYAPVSKLCRNGLPSAITANPTTYAWQCAGVGGGADASCAATREYDVIASAQSGGQIAPGPLLRTTYQATPAFTITPGSGFRIDAVGGDCGGALSGTTYTVNPVTANCTVDAVFASDQPPPTLTGATTARGPTGGGTTLTLSGTGFVPGATTVTIGGQPCGSVTVQSPTQLTCVTPAGPAGAQPVVIATPGGTIAGTFTYDSIPTLTGIAPNQGPLAGGTRITLSGTDLVAGATSVTVGGQPCGSVTVPSPTQLTCVTPAGAAGAQPVIATTPGGVSNARVFTYGSTTPPTDIPTLSQWGLLLLGALLALIARWRGPMQPAGRR